MIEQASVRTLAATPFVEQSDHIADLDIPDLYKPPFPRYRGRRCRQRDDGDRRTSSTTR